MSLERYKKKRDFSRTKEPRGNESNAQTASRFVIQKHAASRLHYDFRLELNGTLKSWSVPKGLPYTKGEKRLAVEVEDHPVEYASFEGVIPKGQYGGGTVMLWDHGTYFAVSDNSARDLARGKLHILLEGEKVRGEWALIRIRSGEGNQWLLMKIGEEMRPISRKRDDESVLTGRTMAKIASDGEPERPPKVEEKHSTLAFIEPMKAKLAEAPPASGEWIYEVKFDGYRIVALKEGKRVTLLSRNKKDLSARFPEIAEAIAGLRVKTAIFDGEIVALDEAGRPSFQLLQGTEQTAAPLAYYLFDLIRVDEKDLRALPLSDRKARLAKVIQGAGEPLRFSADLRGDPKQLLAKAARLQLEGLIGKRMGSTYEAGRRSGAWIKLKCTNAPGIRDRRPYSTPRQPPAFRCAPGRVL